MANDNEYADVDQVKARYSKEFLKRITNFTGVDDGTAVVDARITEATKDASDLMDGFLQGRYDVPVETPPDHFIGDCIKIAVKLLVEHKGYDEESSEKNYITAGNEVLKKYEKIAEGKISLGVPGPGGSTTVPVKIKTDAPPKVFPCAKLDKY